MFPCTHTSYRVHACPFTFNGSPYDLYQSCLSRYLPLLYVSFYTFCYFCFLIYSPVNAILFIRNLIAASSFEQRDKSRTHGRNPILKVIVSALDKVTFSNTSESTDTFELKMIKPSSNLKNTNGVICEHYKRSNIKILEVTFLDVISSFFVLMNFTVRLYYLNFLMPVHHITSHHITSHHIMLCYIAQY